MYGMPLKKIVYAQEFKKMYVVDTHINMVCSCKHLSLQLYLVQKKMPKRFWKVCIHDFFRFHLYIVTTHFVI